jgi:hypothetical protein
MAVSTTNGRRYYVFVGKAWIASLFQSDFLFTSKFGGELPVHYSLLQLIYIIIYPVFIGSPNNVSIYEQHLPSSISGALST